MFYNTTGLFGEPLKQAEQRALKQDEEILEVFEKYPQLKLGASNIHEILVKRKSAFKRARAGSYHSMCKAINNPPITSVRRAINTLYSEGKIERCGKQKIEKDWEFTYQIRR